MGDVENSEELFVPRYDPVKHPFYYAALEPPHERPFHSYSTSSGRPPTPAEVACMRFFFSRYRHYRFKSRTYQNGLRVDCLWLIDGVIDERDNFDHVAKQQEINAE